MPQYLQPNRIRPCNDSLWLRACSEGVITRGFQPLVPGSNPGGRTINHTLDEQPVLRRSMRPRQLLGLAMLFLFLPTNSGLYLSLLQGATPSDKVPGDFVTWMCCLFIIGILLVLIPSRDQVKLSIDESE